MSLEGPFLTAVIARLPEAKYNLAAYGIAFSFALIVEAPIIMIMSAVVALVKDSQSYYKMRNYTFYLNYSITGIMLVFLIPDFFFWISQELIGLTPEISELAYFSTVILLPWPGAIGFRRFYQGVLIKYNRTRRVAYGTLIRMTSMAGTASILYFMTGLNGAYVGASALSVGVVLEALASRLMAGDLVTNFTRQSPKIIFTQDKNALTYWKITKFYFPLALSSILGLGVYPVVNFFIGHSRMPIESLAVLPVINSLNFMFVCIGLSYQEVGIALLGTKNNQFKPLKNFAYLLGIVTEFGIALIAFTPLAYYWFRHFSGLSIELTEFAILPFQLTVLMPALMIVMSFQRALLMNSNHTDPITWATGIEVGGIALSMFIAIHYFNAIGAVAAAIALFLGRFSAMVYLFIPFARKTPKLPLKLKVAHDYLGG